MLEMSAGLGIDPEPEPVDATAQPAEMLDADADVEMQPKEETEMGVLGVRKLARKKSKKQARHEGKLKLLVCSHFHASFELVFSYSMRYYVLDILVPLMRSL